MSKIKSIIYNWLSVMVISAVSMSVYIRTLLPGVGAGGDSAEFQFVGKVLGIPHNTGYPLYVVLNWLFIHLPIDASLAYKVNLLSGIFAVIASIFLFLILSSITNNRLISAGCALLFAFTRNFWSQAVIAEVYTLNVLFVAIVIFFLIKWFYYPEKTFYFYSASFFYALSFGNHLTVILLLPAFAWMTFIRDKDIIKKFKSWVLIGLFILVGILQYSYLFIRSYQVAPYAGARIYNLSDFVRFVTGAQYHTQDRFFNIVELINQRFPFFIEQLNLQFPHFLFHIIAIVGIGFIVKKYWRLGLFFLIAIVSYIFFPISWQAPDIPNYLIPSYLFYTIFMGVGIWYIWRIANKKLYINERILCIIFSIIFSACIIYLYNFNYNDVDQSDKIQEEKLVLDILDYVEKDAVIVSGWYRYSEFFWYFLLTDEKWKNKNIYLVHHIDLVSIKSYLERKQSIYLPEEAKYIPVGLPVYYIFRKPPGFLAVEIDIDSGERKIYKLAPLFQTRNGTKGRRR